MFSSICDLPVQLLPLVVKHPDPRASLLVSYFGFLLRMFGTTGDFYLTWFEKIAALILKAGPIPNHVALILDGNRRFARKNNMANVWEGHQLGFDHVDDVVDMFLEMGIKEMTIYVFSVENFKRPKDEVDAIMKILLEKTTITDGRLNTMKRKGITYEYIGDLTKTPNADLRNNIERNMVLSRGEKKLKLNVAFVYTGRNEITYGANKLIEGLTKGQIEMDQVSEKLLKESFTLHFSHPVDIMIRTSGETRLSDYVTWGCSEATLEFIPETWPEFSAWRLIKAIFAFQRKRLFEMEKKNHLGPTEAAEVELEHKSMAFLEAIRGKRWSTLG